MIRKFYLSLLLLIIFSSINLAQLYHDSWNFGFGLAYPGYLNTNLSPNKNGIGLYSSLQKNFSEHVGLRFLADYNHIEGDYNNIRQKTNLVSGNFDLMYYLVPCEPLSPYFQFGVGGIYFHLSKQLNPGLTKKSFFDFQFNIGFGAEYSIMEDWKLNTEFGYITVSNSNLDGIPSDANDTYIHLSVGLLYFFEKGEPSKICELCSGVTVNCEKIDYDRIENMIKKYQAKHSEPVDYNRIETIVKKYQSKVTLPNDRWVLIGVNFNFNSAKLKPESFPTLDDAVRILTSKPELKIEIQGYTDNIGIEVKNQRLSLERAVTVMNYLIAKGIAADRLTAVGFGSKNPVADNNTESGRLLNRRIEFKVIEDKVD